MSTDGFKAPSLPPVWKQRHGAKLDEKSKPLSSSVEEAGARQETVTEEDGVASQRSREKEEEDREEKDNNVPKKDEEKLNDVNMKEDDKEEDGKESGTRVELQSTSSQPKSTYHPVRLPGSQPPPPPPPPPLPYTEPHWSGLPTQPFSLTVIKNGSVVEEIDISTKPFLVFGRLPVCDVALEHPSISRYHAILQHRPQEEKRREAGGTGEGEGGKGERERRVDVLSCRPSESGFYVYDLASTHGTYLNKNMIRPRSYYRVRVGQMIRFGGSSRLFVLEPSSPKGLQEAVEAEAEAEICLFQQQKREKERIEQEVARERERLAREREEMGATWGMVLDEVHHKEQEVEEGEELNLDPDRESYYKADPKKALKKFFDREGLELDYEVDEEGPLHARVHTVRVRLPIEVSSGEEVVVEEVGMGKRKEVVVRCALKACRVLDSHGMLRKASQGHQRKMKNWEENDYYDSDEDSFLDRTGELERKRKQRMRRLGKLQETAESFLTLQAKLEEVCREKEGIASRLTRAQIGGVQGGVAEADSLDSFMSTVSTQLDPLKRTELRHRLQELKKEEERIRKLLKIAKPTELPSINKIGQPPPQDTGVPASTTAHAVIHDDDVTTNNQTFEPTSCSGDLRLVSDVAHQLPGELKITRREEREGGSGVIEERGEGKGGGGGGGGGRRGGRGRVKRSDGNVGKEQRADIMSVHSLSVKKPRLVGPALPLKQKRDMQDTQTKPAPWQEDSDYASWLPPENQSGDGRTYLNEKYGY